MGNEYQQIVEDVSGRTINIGSTYIFKARVETLAGGNPRYSFKVWEQGAQEPAAWDLTLDQGVEDPQSGSVLLLAHQVDAIFGNVVIIPVTNK